MIAETLQTQIDSGIEILKSGGIVAYPTDTVYGIAAHAFSNEAVERVFEIKGRPKDMAIPLLISNVDEVSQIAINIPDIVNIVAKYFWPGALTIILEKSPQVSRMISSKSTIAVRVPNHPVPIGLINGIGAPITGTSANISSNPAAITSDEVRKVLGHKLDQTIDQGPEPLGIESTILDLTAPSPRILREGAISKQTIEKACNLVLS